MVHYHKKHSWSLIHPLGSAINTPKGKSKELSIDLKEHIIDLNKSEKSLGAISKQLQIPRSTMQKTVVSINFMAQLCHCHDQNPNYHLLLKEKLSGWSIFNKKHLKASLQWIRSCWNTKGQCQQSSLFCIIHGLKGCCARKKPLIQTQYLNAWLQFATDHMDKEKVFWRE